MTWVTQARLVTRPVPSGAMAHGRRVSYRTMRTAPRVALHVPLSKFRFLTRTGLPQCTVRP